MYALPVPGSIFVYTAYEPTYEFRLSDNYCERIVYKIAFWFTNAIYLVILIVLLGLCFSWIEKLITERARKKSHIMTVS